jgi:hypothetical protein
MGPTNDFDLTVIVPVGGRCADAESLHAEYAAGLAGLGLAHEIIYVLDGPRRRFAEGQTKLLGRGEALTVIQLTRGFGEATALMAGFERASGRMILTLPAYHQIRAADAGKLVRALSSADVAIARRWPRAGGALERARRAAFHGPVAWVAGKRFGDLGCGARAMHRRVLEEIALYGDQHRFLPVLALSHGFRVVEVDVQQSAHDRFEGAYRAREYAHRVLDIFTLFFLVRFTKKPLRFFGMLGAATFALGAPALAWVVVERLFLAQPLADRPMLLIASLLVVLGMQLFALGLLGELIIFTHARDLKDYRVAEVIEYPRAGVEDVPVARPA